MKRSAGTQATLRYSACAFVCGAVHSAWEEDWTPRMAAEVKIKAKDGDSEAQCLMGELYAQGKGVLQDMRESAFWFEKAAAKGHAEAAFNLTSLGLSVGYGKKRRRRRKKDCS